MTILFLLLFTDVFVLYSCCVVSKRADEASEKIIIAKRKRNS